MTSYTEDSLAIYWSEAQRRNTCLQDWTLKVRMLVILYELQKRKS